MESPYSTQKGIAKIPFTDLPQEYRTKYNYNPTNAVAYTRAMNQKRATARIRQQANMKRQQEKNAAAKRAADAAAKRSATKYKKPPTRSVVRAKEEENTRGPAGQNVTVVIERKKTQSELLGDIYEKRYNAQEKKDKVRRIGR